jgi:serine/threonine protein phosphatase PrpC
MIPAERAHLYVTAATHAGMRGKNNEDRYAVSAFLTESGTPCVLGIVADGIGGHRAGEVAAELAVETISQQVVEGNSAVEPVASLREAIERASQAILDLATSDPSKGGMGSTCVCALVIGDQLYSASVGDSRLYLVRGGAITQLTTDHTWIQEALEHGVLTPEQARGHPNAHIIRRYLGSKNSAEADFRLRLKPEESDKQAEANQGLRLLPGDQLLLCSDGLSDLVGENEILSTLGDHGRVQALSRLIDLANERGGHDNITIVLLEMPGGGVTAQTFQTSVVMRTPGDRSRRQARLIFGCLVAAGVMVVLAVVVGAFGWILTRPRETPTPTPTLTPKITTTIQPIHLPSETPEPSSTSAPTDEPKVATHTPTPLEEGRATQVEGTQGAPGATPEKTIQGGSPAP